MNKLNLFADDATLRSSAQSRNCLSNADEDEAARALAANRAAHAVALNPALDPARPIFVSAGGPLTSEFFKAMGVDNVVETSGDARAFARAMCAMKPLRLLVVAALRTSERVAEDASTTSRLRCMATDGPVPGAAPLEPGNLVQGHVAALLEAALLAGVPCACFFIPRELSVDDDATALLVELATRVPLFSAAVGTGAASRLKASPAWMQRAMDADERIKRRVEPEGFFL